MGLFGKKDYAAKWMNMSQEDKISMIQSNFNGIVEGHVRTKFIKAPPQNVNDLIEKLKQTSIDEGWFVILAEKITEGYKKSGLNKAPNKVVRSYAFNFLKSYLNLLSQQSKSDGCVKCGNLSFEYDNYFNEYTCNNCGWTVSEKPNGEIIIKNEADTTAEKLSGEKNHVNRSQSMSPEEVSIIIREYGDAMDNNAPPPGGVADVSNLPFPKSKIKEAIIKAIQTSDDPEMSKALKIGYIQLSDWQEGVGDTIHGFDFLADASADKSTKEVAELFIKEEGEMEKWREKIKQESLSLKEELVKLGLWE